MKGIYLAAFRARHPNYDIIYQDINPKCKCDLQGDMLEVDLKDYDFIIATPPCNYWSRANYRRETSEYAQKTKHLLPEILKKLCYQNKPFIVENVMNKKRFTEAGLFNLPCHVYFVGRHTYWSNIYFETKDIPQEYDFKYGGYIRKTIQDYGHSNRQGGDNVAKVIERFLEVVHNG